jgi:hypothetical protein
VSINVGKIILRNVGALVPDCTVSHPEDRCPHGYRPEKLDLAQAMNSTSCNAEFHVYLLSDIMASSLAATKLGRWMIWPHTSLETLL